MMRKIWIGQFIVFGLQVADATAHMVEAAKGCASSPKDRDQQQQLRLAAEELRAATTVAASSALKKKIIKKLEVHAISLPQIIPSSINRTSFLFIGLKMFDMQ